MFQEAGRAVSASLVVGALAFASCSDAEKPVGPPKAVEAPKVIQAEPQVVGSEGEDADQMQIVHSRAY